MEPYSNLYALPVGIGAPIEASRKRFVVVDMLASGALAVQLGGGLALLLSELRARPAGGASLLEGSVSRTCCARDGPPFWLSWTPDLGPLAKV